MTTPLATSPTAAAVRQEARTEARFRLIFDRAPLGIALAEPTTRRIFRVNQVYAAILGRSRAELEGLDWLSLTHPDDREDHLRDHARLTAGDLATYSSIRRCLRPDGVVVLVNMTRSLMKPGPDAPSQELIIVEDITQRTAMEAQLQASEEKYRNLVETISDCIWEVDAQIRFTYLSPRFADQMGYSPADFLGRTPVDLLPAEEKGLVGERLLALFASQQPFVCQEFTCQHREGYPIVIEASGLPFFDDRGQFLGARGISRDVSRRKEFEHRLRLSEQRQQLIAKHSLDLIWTMNLEGEFTYLSPSLTNILGYTPDEYRALPATKTYTPEAFAIVQQGLEQARACVTAGQPFHFRAELENRTKDGGSNWSDVNATAIYDEQGRFVEIMGVTRDITQRKEAEEQLRISEERHRLIAENADDVLWTMGLDGRFTYVSPSVANLRGFSVAEVMNQTWAEIFTPESLSLVQAQFQDFLARMQRGEPLHTVRLELRQLHRDGHAVWTDVLASPLVGRDGRFKEILGVTRNIDDRKRAEAEIQHLNDTLEQRVAERTAQLAAEINERQQTAARLQASERRYRELNDGLEREVATRTAEARAASAAKSEFLAQMSHEIRTPLYSMLGLAQLINREPLSPHQREMVGRIQRAGQSLLGILNDILDLAKIEASYLRIESRPFELSALLRRLTDLYGPSAFQKGLLLLLKLPPLPPNQLEGDDLRLEQILGNLISNAIKFTERGKILVEVELLEASEEQLRLRFSVRDTGIGIAPATLRGLFQPFIQGEGGHGRRFGGTGLGLAISKRLVEMMDGTIGADSQPGNGSHFWVDLPFKRMAIAHRGSAAETLPWAARKSSLSGLRILVVDDSADHRDLMDQALRLEGAEVKQACDGTQAIDLLKAHPNGYDLVLMDMQMPGMDGFSATMMIRNELGMSDLPIIALTAGILPEQREAAIDAGVDEILTKPIDLDQIAARLSIRAPSRAGATKTTWADPLAAESPPPTPDSPCQDLGQAAGFPEIPGINRHQVEKRLAGNRVIFLKLLRGFAKQFDQMMADTRSDLDHGNLEEAAGRLHRLRGYAATIGAMGLGQQAGGLEDAIRRGETGLTEALQVLETELLALLAAMAPWVTTPGSIDERGPDSLS